MIGISRASRIVSSSGSDSPWFDARSIAAAKASGMPGAIDGARA